MVTLPCRTPLTSDHSRSESQVGSGTSTSAPERIRSRGLLAQTALRKRGGWTWLAPRSRPFRSARPSPLTSRFALASTSTES